MNIANAITLTRLLSVPVFVWLVLMDMIGAAFWLFLAAAISDAVDGIIAKKFEMQTNLGAYLDPLADKVLLVTAYIVLGSKGLLPVWLVITVVSPDALIVGGALLFDKQTGDLSMEPLKISKVNTVVQLLLILCAMTPTAFALHQEGVITLLSYAALLTTLASGAAYVYIWTHRAHEFEHASKLDQGEDKP
ncbi:MAG: CDP-alcohol phosphatidyltransferase family protein [Rhodospirillales bacterium]